MSTRTRVRGTTNVGFVTLVVVDCASCGVIFGVTDDFDSNRRNDSKGFYCPNGHSLSYSESEEDRLRKRLERVEGQRDRAENRANAEGQRALLAERQRNAFKGQVTKIKKRVAKGVCPACNRHFADVHRHMTTQHPDFVEVHEHQETTP